MSRVDELPPDQRAALSLLLRQGQTYAQLSEVLSISERAVHDRAHSALAVLAPRQARGLTQAQREQIGDYLLGQDGAAGRVRARTQLAASPEALAWAQALAAELATIAPSALPEIPDSTVLAPPPTTPSPAPPPAATPAQPRPPGASEPPRASAGGDPTPAPFPRPQGSRVGGAVLLGLIVVVIVVAVILLKGGGSSNHTGTSHTTSGTTSTASASEPHIAARLPLRSPSRASRSIGVVEILAKGTTRAFYAFAEHLPPTRGFFYALWLYNSPTSSLPLGRAPAVGANGRLEGGGPLPSNASQFRSILLTRETSTHARTPSRVILRGPFSLGGA